MKWRRDDPERAQILVRQIHELTDGPVRLMEVCGTHTVSIFRAGIRAMMPAGVELISGPGCPVCVTPTGEIDRALELARRPEVILLTFGDLMRVPGSQGSLEGCRAEGGDVRVILSPLDAVEVAQRERGRRVVFFAVGFETTSPAIAAAVREAQRRGLDNFYLLSAQRLIPPAIRALLEGGRVGIDGFILPGHVSVIIGSRPYEFIAREFDIPAVITGFEPLDILEGIWMLLKQRKERRASVEIQYRRAVKEEGNPRALAMMEEVFKEVDARWRGLGVIPSSGLVLREDFSHMDAVEVFGLPYRDSPDPPGCLCGEILQGLKRPPDCPLFGRRCRPETPVGPCMVSSEGTCAAYYKYGGDGG